MDTSLLSKLAPEIRNEIYSLALTHPSSIKFKTITSDSEPGLLRTCRQLREEARSYYYANNAFNIDFDPTHICHFLKRFQWLKDKYAQKLSTITQLLFVIDGYGLRYGSAKFQKILYRHLVPSLASAGFKRGAISDV